MISKVHSKPLALWGSMILWSKATMIFHTSLRTDWEALQMWPLDPNSIGSLEYTSRVKPSFKNAKVNRRFIPWQPGQHLKFCFRGYTIYKLPKLRNQMDHLMIVSKNSTSFTPILVTKIPIIIDTVALGLQGVSFASLFQIREQ